MICLKHSLGEFDELQILPLADLHIGDIHSDGKKIMEWIEYIKNTPNCYTIINGDVCDVAIRHSIGDIYGATLQPMEQLKQCVKIFGPIKDKILLFTSGNHERRIYRETGMDLTQVMANQLEIGERYAPESALLFIQFGKQSGHKKFWPMTYIIYAVHGSANGRQEGSKINRLVQLANIVDADIYLHSHTHTPAIVRNSYYRTIVQQATVVKVDKLFINTSAALNWGGYGEALSFKPNSIETPLIILDGHKRKMRAIL